MVGAFRVSGESSWRLLPAVRGVPVPRGGVSRPAGVVLGLTFDLGGCVRACRGVSRRGMHRVIPVAVELVAV